MKARLVLGLVLVMACKGEAKETKRVHGPPPKVENVEAKCVGVAAKARAAWLDQADRAKTEGPRAYSEYMADAVVRVFERHCTDDKWSDAAIACAKGAGSANCDAALTPEQLDKMKNDPKINL